MHSDDDMVTQERPIDGVIRRMKRLKREYLRHGFYGGNLPCVVEFHRDGTPAAELVMNSVNRDKALMATRVGVYGFRADLIYWVHDVYLVLDFGKEDHFPLEPGELQRRWESGDRSNVAEGLAVMEVKRDVGVTCSAQCAYRVVESPRKKHKKRTIHWFRDTFAETDGPWKMSGIVTNALTDMLRSPTITDRVAAAGVDVPRDFGITETTATGVADVATAQMLLGILGAATVGLFGRADDDERKGAIEEAARESKLQIHYLGEPGATTDT